MAIKVIRICDLCGSEHKQFAVKSDENIKLVEYDVNFLCSDCLLEIGKLEDLQSIKNDGRGVYCVSAICSKLKESNIEIAKSIYRAEGDKICSYPKIQQWFYKKLGCRLHSNIDCQNELCKNLKKYYDEDLKT